MGITTFSGPVRSIAGFMGPDNQVLVLQQPIPTSIATAGNVTYTADQLLTGLILRDPAGGARTDILPTAAQIVAAIPKPTWGGQAFSFTIVNTADAAETISLTMGAGMTNGTLPSTTVSSAIAQNTSRTFTIRITNATPGAEAVTIYA